jgi:Leucine-rich repeat (LRR) protein
MKKYAILLLIGLFLSQLALYSQGLSVEQLMEKTYLFRADTNYNNTTQYSAAEDSRLWNSNKVYNCDYISSDGIWKKRGKVVPIEEVIQNAKSVVVIGQIPPSLYACKGLEHLSISTYTGAIIPEAIEQLQNLTSFHIHDADSLIALPKAFVKMPRLEILHFTSVDSLKRLFNDISILQHIKILIVNVNYKKDSVDFLSNLTQLEVLSINAYDAPVNVNLDFSRLTNLKGLELSGFNNTEQLGSGWSALKKLQSLNISSCPKLITSLGQSLKSPQIRFLNLAYNNLKVIPDWAILPNLQYLNMTGNPLERIDKKWAKLTNLVNLILLSTPIVSIEEGVCSQLSQLRWLLLESRQLKQLPADFGALSNLEAFNLTYAPIEFLPPSFSNLSKLRRLVIETSNIQALPDDFGRLTSLKLIILSHLKITYLPQTFGDLTHLEYLYLGLPNLKALPDKFGGLISLRHLDLTSIVLDSLPISFCNLLNINYLSLKGIRIKSLPECFGNLSHLSEIEIYNSDLTSLPKSFGQLSELKELWITGRAFSELPEEALMRLTSLELLKIESTSLSVIPKSIGYLSQLKFLYIQDCQLLYLPSTLGSLTRLKGLDLPGNKLTDLPEVAINSLKQLKLLNLTRNQIAQLPNNLDLPILEVLDLSHNQMKTIPVSVFRFPNLTSLNLAFNELTSLPTGGGGQNRLKDLKINNNKLYALPDYITELSALEDLNISGNNTLYCLPKNFHYLKSLKKINMSACMIRKLPEEIGSMDSNLYVNARGNLLTLIPISAQKNHRKMWDLFENPIDSIEMDRLTKRFGHNVFWYSIHEVILMDKQIEYNLKKEAETKRISNFPPSTPSEFFVELAEALVYLGETNEANQLINSALERDRKASRPYNPRNFVHLQFAILFLKGEITEAKKMASIWHNKTKTTEQVHKDVFMEVLRELFLTGQVPPERLADFDALLADIADL